MAGRGSGRGSQSRMTTAEEGTDLVLDLVGLDESPLVARVRRLGCFEVVEDTCFV